MRFRVEVQRVTEDVQRIEIDIEGEDGAHAVRAALIELDDKPELWEKAKSEPHETHDPFVSNPPLNLDVIEFTQMVDDHDLTYTYSDDQRYYDAGQRSMEAIMAYRAKLPWQIAYKIWNAAVDRKIVIDSRKEFYWPEAAPK